MDTLSSPKYKHWRKFANLLNGSHLNGNQSLPHLFNIALTVSPAAGVHLNMDEVFEGKKRIKINQVVEDARLMMENFNKLPPELPAFTTTKFLPEPPE